MLVSEDEIQINNVQKICVNNFVNMIMLTTPGIPILGSPWVNQC